MTAAALTPLAALEGDDYRILAAMEGGLPLVARPYAALAEQLGLSEQRVITRLAYLQQSGLIRRLGVVVRHRALGYRANAMVVWDLPAAEVDEIGSAMGALPFVTLCYRRPRRLPHWPYNLFCMIHGRSRAEVLQQVAAVAIRLGLERIDHRVLFSQRCFKQRSGHYVASPPANPVVKEIS